MQAAKNAAASAKETAANVAASAKAGMEKTKAAVQEQVEKMSAHDPVHKDMATERKEERIHQAEYNKQEAREHNAAARQSAAGGGTQNYNTGGGGMHQNYSNYSTGAGGNNPDYLTGSDMSGYGTGHHNGNPTGGNDFYDHQYLTGGSTGLSSRPDQLTGSNMSGYHTGNPNDNRFGSQIPLGGNTDAYYSHGANNTGTGLNPRSTDAVYPDEIGSDFNPTRDLSGGGGGAPTSGYGNRGAYN